MAILKETAEANIETVKAALEAHRGPVGPLLRQLLAMLAGRMSTTRLPDLIKLVISESRAHPELGRLYLERVIRVAVPMVTSLIQRGIESGEFRKVDAGFAARSLISPMLLAAIWRSVFEPLGGEPLDVAGLANQHADIILNGLSVRPYLPEVVP
jgi:hypothetical protein